VIPSEEGNSELGPDEEGRGALTSAYKRKENEMTNPTKIKVCHRSKGEGGVIKADLLRQKRS